MNHEFSPNSPPRGLCSDLGPKGGKKEPKDAKRLPKDTKRSQTGAKRIPKSCENQLKKSRTDTETIYKSSSLSDSIRTTPCQGTVAGLPQASGYRYTGVLLDFHGFRVPRGGQKTIKKTMQKTERRKRRRKTVFLPKSVKIDSNMDSDLDHEFSPNSPPRGLCSDLGPKGGKKEPKGAKRHPKTSKGSQNDTKII